MRLFKLLVICCFIACHSVENSVPNVNYDIVDRNMDPSCPIDVIEPTCFWRLNLAAELNIKGRIVKRGDCVQICHCKDAATGWCVVMSRSRVKE